MRDKEIVSRSAAETKRIGSVLGKYLQRGDVVALEGGLGAGKTTLVKGIASGLGVKGRHAVTSPTFVIMHEYLGRERLLHLDWYRLKKVTGPDADTVEDAFQSGVTVIEWPDRGCDLMPREKIRIQLVHEGGSRRKIRISVTRQHERLLRQAGLSP